MVSRPLRRGWIQRWHWSRPRPSETLLPWRDPRKRACSKSDLMALDGKLEELGVKSVVFDPCGNKPSQGDFNSLMESNIASLEQVLM